MGYKPKVLEKRKTCVLGRPFCIKVMNEKRMGWGTNHDNASDKNNDSDDAISVLSCFNLIYFFSF